MSFTSEATRAPDERTFNINKAFVLIKLQSNTYQESFHKSHLLIYFKALRICLHFLSQLGSRLCGFGLRCRRHRDEGRNRLKAIGQGGRTSPSRQQDDGRRGVKSARAGSSAFAADYRRCGFWGGAAFLSIVSIRLPAFERRIESTRALIIPTWAQTPSRPAFSMSPDGKERLDNLPLV